MGCRVTAILSLILAVSSNSAFDKVSHWRLAVKLKNYGITGSTNKWIEDFLNQRIQQVVCNGRFSDWASVKSGVPQGSVIGPILFLIYINDLPEEVKSTVRLFADDTIMYMTMTSTNDAALLQKDLDNLASWEKKWQMQFHPQKCSFLRITRKKTTQIHEYRLHGHILKSENSSKYLGVTIDNKLCWNDHIDNICNKANGSLAFLRRNLKISQTHIKDNTYTTQVRPQLEYAAAVWDKYTEQNQDQLEMVQRSMSSMSTPDFHMLHQCCNS